MSPQGKNINVLVVDESVVYRTLINTSLSVQPNINVVETISNAYDAQEKIAQLSPDVLILDVVIHDTSSIELTKELISKFRIPIILVGTTNLSAFDTLQTGAIDFIKKPDANYSVSAEAFIDELVSKIKIASMSRISKQIPLCPTITSEHNTETESYTTTSANAIFELPFKDCSDNVCNSAIIAIGASTGGTESILEVLQRLPAKIPPILIVQHMPTVFTKLYAERLNKICAMKVKEAADDDIVAPGQVYIAPGNYQMRLVKIGNYYKLNCKDTRKVSGHCPSVDVLFESVSKESLNKNIGIILTGMGKDGANGLLEMKKNGAYTIGESPESCVVYGMPMAAQDIGAVTEQARNKEIPNLLIKYLNTIG